jgi:hypothetical protein
MIIASRRMGWKEQEAWSGDMKNTHKIWVGKYGYRGGDGRS